MPELAYYNGKILPIEEASVPIEDRGYQFGDAVYEFIASYKGKLFCMADHLDRLESSMEKLAFPALSRTFLEETVVELFKSAQFDRAAIYIQVSRGAMPRDHAWNENLKPQVVMTAKEIKQFTPEFRKKGVDIITLEDERWANCDIKTVQLLPNAVAKHQAKQQGVFDAVFVSADGIVREGTSSNFFIVKDGTLITHPLSRSILPGITRKVVLSLAEELGVNTMEDFIPDSDLYTADEAFLTGTVTEIMGIRSINGRTIGSGSAGNITQSLYKAFRIRTNAE